MSRLKWKGIEFLVKETTCAKSLEKEGTEQVWATERKPVRLEQKQQGRESMIGSAAERFFVVHLIL